MKLSLKISIYLLLFFWVTKVTNAQHYQNGNFGINLGVVAALGSHFDRIGVNLSTFYQTNHIQFNPTFRVYFNAKNLGPKKQYLEASISLGIVYAYGKIDTSEQFFYSPISNQTPYKNSIGYAYNFYFNNIKTSQRTGTISFEVNRFSLIVENDLFAQPKLDQFRTGAIAFNYQHNKFLYTLNITLFTGRMGKRIIDEMYPFNHIYKTTAGGLYTESSHGLLSTQIKYAGPYQQLYQANLGVDAEQVRHTVQNRWIHDFLTLPFLTGKENAHIPMITNDGKQYLFKENQKIRPPKLYWNLFSNAAFFY